MVVLHYHRTGADAMGTTTGAEEEIGTYQIPSKATGFYGWIFQDGSTATTTTAEATQGKFIASSPEITGSPQEFLAGSGSMSGAGTNESSLYDPGIFIPFTPRITAFQNSTLSYSYDTCIEMTQENYAQVFTLWSSGGVVPATAFRNRGYPLDGINEFLRYGQIASDVDIYDEAIEIMAETITLPTAAKRIVACIVSVKSDAIETDGEHFAGYIDMSSTLLGIEPMHLPMPLGTAGIGTAVDWPDGGMVSYIYPMYIDLTGRAAETFTFTVRLAATVTAAMLVTINLLAI